MKDLLAFADEYGNNSFDFTTQSTHFIVASIIISPDQKQSFEQGLEIIRKKYFQTGEIKSNKIGDNHTRRLIILNELVKLDFHIYAVVVDKRKIVGEGFKYKKSFYKFLNGLLYNELFKTYPNLRLCVDEHGENEFMLSFKKYVEENHKPNLFAGSEFGFMGSPDSIIIQAADLIAGTLGRCYDEQKSNPYIDEYLDILKSKILSVNFFPRDKNSLFYESNKDDKNFNNLIAELSYNLSVQFLEKKKRPISQEEIDQINCVKLLLFYFKSYDTKNYVSTKEILKHLQVGRDEVINEQYFRSKIIAKLRDEGLLIASSSKGEKKKGYKLPTSDGDLYDFINHGNMMIVPMVARIERCRDIVKMATRNGLDILDKHEFTELKEILDKKSRLTPHL